MNDKMKLALYIAEYINEEIERGNTQVDKWMVLDALNAYEGGATEVAAAPDLLEVARQIVLAAEQQEGSIPSDIVSGAYTAILKATGEAA